MSSTEPRVHSQINEYQARQRSSRLWHKIVSALACVVVFCTTYALILPAITMETPRILDCPLEVHSHTPDCYDADGDLICGQADFVVHTHTQSCYGTDGGLVCLLSEIGDHTHTDDCYTVERLLICDLDVWEEPDVPEAPEETVVHEHGENCYAAERGALICGREEDGDHEHTDECYERVPILTCGQEESAGHAHDESCYTEETALLCGLEETAGHEHDANCYTTGRGALICGSEDEDHTHTDECYEQISVLSCNLEEGEGAHTHQEECLGQISLLSCGLEEGEGAHTHTVDCRLLICGLEEGERVPVETEPAQADSADQTGTDTDAEAAPTSEKVLGDGDAEAAPTSERVPGHIHTDECYEITRTLICDTEEIVLHTHTGACYEIEYDEETGEELSRTLICGQLEILEHVHTDECFVLVEESAPAVYAYEDETIAAEVTLAEGSALPEGTELVVRPITGMTAYSLDGETGDDGYEDLVRRAEEAVGQPVTDILLYDISFYTPDGEYLPVEDSATVSLRFKEAVFPEGTGGVTVLHYAEDGDLPVTLDSVDVERDENDAPAALTFQTEGFSVYAVVTVTDGDYQRITDVKDLAGQSVAILSNGAKYAMTAVATTDNKGLQYTAVASLADLSEYTIWTFEQSTDETYYISSNGSYLVMGNQTLTTTATKNNATAFTITIKNGLAEISASVSRTTYYVNLFGGENNPSGFKSYTSSTGNLQQLYVKAEQTEDGVPFTGLDGKSYVIANLNTSARQYAMSSSQSGSQYLSASPVSIVTTDETAYVSGDDLTTWTFTATNTPGVYYIQADDTKQYLSLTSDTLTTSDTPNAITVTTSSTYPGQVKLSANNTAVDWYGGSNPTTLYFGAYSGANQNNYQTLCQPLDASGDMLFYDLGVTATYVDTHIFSGSWASSAPALTDGEGSRVTGVTQVVTADGSFLYSAGTPGGDYEYFTTRAVTERQEIGQKLGVDGKEFRFDGWAATVADESGDQVEYHFAANARAVLKDDGIHITDEDGVERVLPAGTTLTARWTEVSDIVMFFVNYTGTILDTEGDIGGRNQKDFTGIIGIGRVYYGKETAGNDSVFGGDADASIRLKFANAFDPDNPETQIVMEYVTVYDANADSTSMNGGVGYNLYHDADGINDTELETALLSFIQANNNVTIKVSTTDNKNNPEIENENSTPDNYSVRWYVMKEQSDGWHIDGVMVAKTQEVAVAKTFSGLTDTQVKELLNEGSGDGFRMPVQLGEDRQDYITMTTQSIEGQYEYLGQESTGSQSYDWTLHAITDERYTLSEENYDLEGYDVSAVVVHYYRDENGQLQIAYQAGSTTKGLNVEVLGGKTVGVSFNNFYTESGTGAFAIHKSANDRTGQSDVGSALQGATFALYTDADCKDPLTDSNNQEVTSTTNTRGSAYFNNLATGTYYLKETDPPKGYLADGSVWQVVVVDMGTEDDAHIKVTVSQYKDDTGNTVTDDAETLCYDGGIAASYEIHNTPIADTVRVTKTFSGLTIEQLNDLVKDSTKENSDGYYIEVSPNAVTAPVSPGSDGAARLYLQQSTRSQDGWTFTWVISGLKMTDDNGNSIPYKIVERNYFIYNEDGSLAYKDVAVTAAVNGTAQEVDVYRYEETDGRKNAEAGVYGVTFHKDQSDLVELTNHYTNTFNLTLQKIDSVTKQPLPNAVFDIYGSYSESTDTSKRIRYTDPETGGTRTAYYIGTIKADASGIATKTGLSLSEDGSTTFVYVINESFSPSGYVKLDEPIVQTVTVETTGYAHGVYTADVPNTKEEDYVHAALDTMKEWDPSPPTGATVTLELYRVTHEVRNAQLADTVDAVLVKRITLDGEPEEKPEASEDWDENTPSIDKVQVYESEPWVATWMNLYSASRNYSEEDPDHYHYFVREVTTVNGYAVSYTCYDASGAEPEGAFQTLQVTEGGTTKTFQGVLIADMDEAYTATVVNTTSFELPETGGAGTLLYAMGGAFLMAASLLYGYKLRRKWERRYRC